VAQDTNYGFVGFPVGQAASQRQYKSRQNILHHLPVNVSQAEAAALEFVG